MSLVDLQINKSHHEETQKFLDIQPCAPSSFYSGNYKNKIIDVFINYYEKQDPKVSMEFLINGQKIKPKMGLNNPCKICKAIQIK